MQRLLLVITMCAFALPAVARDRVTMAQVQQLLSDAHGKSDAAVAKQLSDLELTERLTEARLLSLASASPGPDTRQALLVLADSSVFLNLPAADIPAVAKPDLTEQRRMMTLVSTYLNKTIPQLPNFFATRTTTRFEESPQEDIQGSTGLLSYNYQPMHFVGKSSSTVLYRDGKEVVDAANGKATKAEIESQGLISRGVFGPILATVLLDASRGGTLVWSHWEEGTQGPVAVLRYVVPSDKSHYEVKYCCVPEVGALSDALYPFRRITGYGGQVSVNATSGTILRITVVPELQTTDPIVKADIMVEYGEVKIGERSYVCPVKSVSISLAPSLRHLTGTVFSQNKLGPKKTTLNDVVFDQYHRFGAESHVIAGSTVEPAP